MPRKIKGVEIKGRKVRNLRNGKFCSTVPRVKQAHKMMEIVAQHRDSWMRNLDHAISDSFTKENLEKRGKSISETYKDPKYAPMMQARARRMLRHPNTKAALTSEKKSERAKKLRTHKNGHEKIRFVEAEREKSTGVVYI